MRLLLTAVTVLSLVPSLLAQQPAPITIYVTTAATRNGFTDPDAKDRADSVADLLRSLKGKKEVALVDDPEKAKLTIEVTGRAWEETGEESSRTVRMPLGGTSTSTTKDKKPVLRATLKVGDYTLPMEGTSPLTWREAANQLAGKISTWVSENRTRLKAQ